jgi:hypothetical protein
MTQQGVYGCLALLVLQHKVSKGVLFCVPVAFARTAATQHSQ